MPAAGTSRRLQGEGPGVGHAEGDLAQQGRDRGVRGRRRQIDHEVEGRPGRRSRTPRPPRSMVIVAVRPAVSTRTSTSTAPRCCRGGVAPLPHPLPGEDGRQRQPVGHRVLRGGGRVHRGGGRGRWSGGGRGGGRRLAATGRDEQGQQAPPPGSAPHGAAPPVARRHGTRRSPGLRRCRAGAASRPPGTVRGAGRTAAHGRTAARGPRAGDPRRGVALALRHLGRPRRPARQQGVHPGGIGLRRRRQPGGARAAAGRPPRAPGDAADLRRTAAGGRTSPAPSGATGRSPAAAWRPCWTRPCAPGAPADPPGPPRPPACAAWPRSAGAAEAKRHRKPPDAGED